MSTQIVLAMTGETPLLHDKPNVDIDEEVDSDATLADKRTHKDFATDTNPVILRDFLLERWRQAGLSVNVGGKPITNANRSLVITEVTIAAIEFVITTSGGSTPHLAYVGGVWHIQPRWDDWEIDVTLLVEEDALSPAKLRDVVDSAGQRIGLAEGDLDPPAYYGQYEVTSWAETPL